MDISKSQGFFSASAKTKQSKAGKDYLSIGVAIASKAQDGSYTKTWLNMIEPRDLLVLANICKDLYSEIEQSKADARFGSNTKAKDDGYQEQDGYDSSADLSDDIPF